MSCFDFYALIGGKCVPCMDPYAVSCLKTNLNYSIFCIPKYTVQTSKYYINRQCIPCADNCLKCDVTGPGNCDTYQCMLGFVQLRGFLNCTACFNSCPVCDPDNLNLCHTCGPSRYIDANGSCWACSNHC